MSIRRRWQSQTALDARNTGGGTDHVKTEIAQRDQLYNDAWKVLEVGLSGGYEQAIAKLKEDSEKAGLSKILEEYQRQVDEFLANK